MKKNLIISFWVFLLGCLTITYAQDAVVKPTINTQEAIFAMGCFWSGAATFVNHDTNEKLSGIIAIRSGYTGGISTNPTYPAHEGHQEAVKIVFNPGAISYAQLLDIFWHNVDPFDAQGQFCDKGKSYTSTIYYKDDTQKKQALESKKTMEKQLKKSIVTAIKAATPFYDAEEYHQDYKSKNPVRYKVYRWNYGRDQRLKEIWK